MGQNTDYVVGWFTLALINAGLAQANRRSGGGWWVASLFLGPVATLILVVTNRPPETTLPTSTPQDTAAEPARCASCGETIPAGQVKCRKCGWTYKEQEPESGDVS